MVQLNILSGKMAGSEAVARHFPFRIGRSAAAHLRLEEDGVWDEHLEIRFDSGDGYVLNAHADALVAVNGHACHEMVLQNGDEIELGALRIRFWLGATRQRSLRQREWLTWAAFVLITAGQLVLIYQYLP